MTSSFVLKKLSETPVNYSPSLPGNTLGGMEDRYIRILGECHPDFTAIPIGKPTGAKLCIRRTEADGRAIGTKLLEASKQNIANNQGYFRGRPRLYDVNAEYPVQKWNPQKYCDRRTPWESELLRRDYLKMPIKYDGTGIKLSRVPQDHDRAQNPYYSYGYSFTPDSDPYTGRRIATDMSQTVPPPKWDVTHLHQPYTLFKSEHEYVGAPQDFRDEQYFQRIV